jgi:hypothetical protein
MDDVSLIVKVPTIGGSGCCQLPLKLTLAPPSHCMHVFFPFEPNLRLSIHIHTSFIQSFHQQTETFCTVIRRFALELVTLRLPRKDLYECELIFKKFLITTTSSETKIIRHYYEFWN